MLEILEQLEEFHLQVSQEANLNLDVQTDLCTAYEQIELRGGLDRETAMAIVGLVPSMEHTANEFTMFPSDTNIQVAVEGFWSGLADAIGSLFGLIFKLIFGILDLLLQPLYWILGVDSDGKSNSSSGSGGLAKAEESVANIEEAVKNKKDAPKEAVDTALTEDILKQSAFYNKLKFLASKNANAHHFTSLSLVTSQLNKFLVAANKDFVKTFGRLDKQNFDTLSKELEVITGQAAGKTVREVNALVKVVNQIWGLKVPSAATSASIPDILKRVEEDIKALDEEKVDTKILYREYSKFAISGTLMTEIKRFNSQLDFRNSDMDLVKAIQKDRNEFTKQEDEVEKLSGDELEKKGLDATQAKELRTLIRNQLTLVRLSTNVSRVATAVSVKGKRGVFDSIKSVEDNIKRIFKQVANDEEDK